MYVGCPLYVPFLANKWNCDYYWVLTHAASVCWPGIGPVAVYCNKLLFSFLMHIWIIDESGTRQQVPVLLVFKIDAYSMYRTLRFKKSTMNLLHQHDTEKMANEPLNRSSRTTQGTLSSTVQILYWKIVASTMKYYTLFFRRLFTNLLTNY